MAFNGSGVFVRLYNWANDKAANIKVRADRMDNEMNGFATGLSTCITKDGQTTITANLPMAGFRHTGVGNASSRNDYSAAGQVQDGKLNWVAAGGTVDALTATYSPAITALVDGQECCVRTSGANATTTPTFAPNGLTARTIVKNGGTALVAGDMPKEAILRYDLSNTRWELLNPTAPSTFTDSVAVVQGSADATKKVRFEVDGLTTGTTRVVTVPDADLTIVGTATTQTLTNKTLTAAVLGGTTNVSGGQLAFPASQSASADVNTLDDYEEGTWTIALTCSTSGTITATGSVDLGSYTKIGNRVHAQGYVEVTSVSSPVGNLRISLPFTAGDTSEFSGRVAALVTLDNTLSANAGPAAAFVEEGTAYITAQNYSATGLTATLANQVKAGTGIYFQATYSV